MGSSPRMRGALDAVCRHHDVDVLAVLGHPVGVCVGAGLEVPHLVVVHAWERGPHHELIVLGNLRSKLASKVLLVSVGVRACAAGSNRARRRCAAASSSAHSLPV